MKHRERLSIALSHKEPDRVPLDFCGTGASSINIDAYENLKKYLGIDCSTVVLSKRSGTALVDESILKRFDIDTRILKPKVPKGKDKKSPNGSFIDAWGVKWAPTGVGTHHVVESPLQDIPNISEIEKYPWPEVQDIVSVEGMREDAKRLHDYTDFGVVLNLPTGIIHQSQFLRGYTNWLIDIAENTKIMEAIFERVLNIWLGAVQKILKETEEFVDVVMWGDDIAFQDCTIVSPELYRKYIKPYQKKMFEFVKSRTKAKILFHSCGAVYPLIGDLINIGVDILNPIQVSAKGMDTVVLKREFGNNLCFWGAIDTQHVLSRGSPRDVRKEVKKRIQNLSKNGGYVLASVHNIQRDVPPENIVAMFEAGNKL